MFVVTITNFRDNYKTCGWAMAETLEPVVFDTREHAEEFVRAWLRAWIKEIGLQCGWEKYQDLLEKYDFDVCSKDVDDEFLEWLDKVATFDDLRYIIDVYLKQGEYVPERLAWRIDELPVRKDGIMKRKLKWYVD